MCGKLWPEFYMTATVAPETNHQRAGGPRSIAASALKRSNRNCYELETDASRSKQRTAIGSNRNHQPENAKPRLTLPRRKRSQFLIEDTRLETRLSPFALMVFPFLIERKRSFFRYRDPASLYSVTAFSPDFGRTSAKRIGSK